MTHNKRAAFKMLVSLNFAVDIAASILPSDFTDLCQLLAASAVGLYPNRDFAVVLRNNEAELNVSLVQGLNYMSRMLPLTHTMLVMGDRSGLTAYDLSSGDVIRRVLLGKLIIINR